MGGPGQWLSGSHGLQNTWGACFKGRFLAMSPEVFKSMGDFPHLPDGILTVTLHKVNSEPQCLMKERVLHVTFSLTG